MGNQDRCEVVPLRFWFTSFITVTCMVHHLSLLLVWYIIYHCCLYGTSFITVACMVHHLSLLLVWYIIYHCCLYGTSFITVACILQ